MNHEEKMISMLEEINQRLVSVEVAQENILIPQIQALAEGQKTILETLAPKSKVEALEEEVELLKSIIKMHTTQQPRRSGRSQAQYSMDLRKKQGGNDGKAKILPAARRTL